MSDNESSPDVIYSGTDKEVVEKILQDMIAPMALLLLRDKVTRIGVDPDNHIYASLHRAVEWFKDRLYAIAKGSVLPGETILEEATRITSGTRLIHYGHPREDFERTAHMWTGILRDKLKQGAEIKATDVPLCMIAVKLARQAHLHKRDNLVDIAGYARTAAVLAGEDG